MLTFLHNLKYYTSFEMRSAKWRFSERQIKKIFFSLPQNLIVLLDRIKSLKSLGLKGLIKREDLIIQKADKSNTVVITERIKYNGSYYRTHIKYNGSYYRTHQI